MGRAKNVCTPKIQVPGSSGLKRCPLTASTLSGTIIWPRPKRRIISSPLTSTTSLSQMKYWTCRTRLNSVSYTILAFWLFITCVSEVRTESGVNSVPAPPLVNTPEWVHPLTIPSGFLLTYLVARIIRIVCGEQSEFPQATRPAIDISCCHVMHLTNDYDQHTCRQCSSEYPAWIRFTGLHQ